MLAARLLHYGHTITLGCDVSQKINYNIVSNILGELADLLLLFIFTEVLGMIGIFFVSNRIPITLPIFIAMTAIARLIILQGKDMNMTFLLYEAGAIFILTLAVLVLRYKPVSRYTYQSDDIAD